MPYKTMSIGGATYDLFVRTGKDLTCMPDKTCVVALPLGDKIRVESVEETSGGGACNTATGLSRLGCASHFCGILGSDQWGERLLGALKKEGVATDAVTIVEGETTSFSIILSVSTGERVILYDRGTNEHLHDVTFDRGKAATMDWIYLNHLQASTSVIEDDLIAILSAPKHPGCTWNPGGSQLERGIQDPHQKKLLALVDLILLNKGEALRFTGEKTPEHALKKLLATGVKNICMTDGKNGVVASDGTSLFRCGILPSDAVDTTGAGDAFGTGATWALLKGLPLPEALRAGTINSSSVVAAVGAQAGLLTDTEMLRRLKGNLPAVDVKRL